MSDQTQDDRSEQTPPQADAPQTPQEQETQESPQAEGLLREDGVQTEEVGKLRKKVTVTVPAEAIDAKRTEMYGELSQSAHVPGFRVGHAPRRLIEKRFGKEVSHDVRNAVVGQTLQEAIDKAKLNILGEPDLELDKIELPEQGDMQYSFEVEVAPEFELPSLEKIKVTKQKLAITPERVDETLEQYRQMQARYDDTEDAAGEGDAVTADVHVSVEGSETIRHEGMTLRVAPGQVEGVPLVDLASQLGGKKAGETVTVTVEVPQAHVNEQWRGKQASVEIKVTQVGRRVLPPLDDEFARSLGFDTLAELRSQVEGNMKVRLAAEERRSMREQVSSYLLDNVAFDLPEGVAARHAARVLQRRYVDLLHRGVPRERIDENVAQLQAAAAEEAGRDLKLSFILGKVAEQQGVEVSEDEINSRIAEMAQAYQRRPERLKQELAADGSISQVEVSLREEKALEKLLEAAEVVEVEPTEAGGEEKADK